MQPFSTAGVDNFGPVYVRNMFNRNLWATLYTCASARNIILDDFPSLSGESLIRSFRRFISRRGCPDNIVSDNGKNLGSKGPSELHKQFKCKMVFEPTIGPLAWWFLQTPCWQCKGFAEKGLAK